jgi:hypothetical protein
MIHFQGDEYANYSELITTQCVHVLKCHSVPYWHTKAMCYRQTTKCFKNVDKLNTPRESPPAHIC